MPLTVVPGLRGPGAGGCFWCSRLYWLALLVTLQLVIGPKPPNPQRDRKELEKGRVTAPTAAIRERLWGEFLQWLEEEDPESSSVPTLARQDPVQLGILVEEYGRCLYERGASRRNFAETVNVLVERFAFAKTFMAGPWRLLTTWESLFPGKVHPPMPLPLLKAVVTTSLAWNWPRFALALLLGLFRPCEVTALKANDCLLASETGCKDVAF